MTYETHFCTGTTNTNTRLYWHPGAKPPTSVLTERGSLFFFFYFYFLFSKLYFCFATYVTSLQKITVEKELFLMTERSERVEKIFFGQHKYTQGLALCQLQVILPSLVCKGHEAIENCFHTRAPKPNDLEVKELKRSDQQIK